MQEKYFKGIHDRFIRDPELRNRMMLLRLKIIPSSDQSISPRVPTLHSIAWVCQDVCFCTLVMQSKQSRAWLPGCTVSYVGARELSASSFLEHDFEISKSDDWVIRVMVIVIDLFQNWAENWMFWTSNSECVFPGCTELSVLEWRHVQLYGHSVWTVP